MGTLETRSAADVGDDPGKPPYATAGEQLKAVAEGDRVRIPPAVVEAYCYPTDSLGSVTFRATGVYHGEGHLERNFVRPNDSGKYEAITVGAEEQPYPVGELLARQVGVVVGRELLPQQPTGTDAATQFADMASHVQGPPATQEYVVVTARAHDSLPDGASLPEGMLPGMGYLLHSAKDGELVLGTPYEGGPPVYIGPTDLEALEPVWYSSRPPADSVS